MNYRVYDTLSVIHSFQMNEEGAIISSESDIGAACEEFKHLIDKCRSEIISLVREECNHNNEVVAEYEESFSSTEVNVLSSNIQLIYDILSNYMMDKIANPDSIFTRHQRKRTLIDLLKKTICMIENINREYETQFLESSASRLKQCMTLDRSLVDIGSRDENDEKSIKTNHAQLEVGAYFSSFSKCIDLNADYQTSSLYLSLIEDLTETISMKHQKICDCLNNMLDKKQNLEEQLSEIQYSIATIKSKKLNTKAEKKEQKLKEFASIAERIMINSSDTPIGKLFRFIVDKPENLTKEEINSCVDEMIDSLSDQETIEQTNNYPLTPQPMKSGLNFDEMISKIKQQIGN